MTIDGRGSGRTPEVQEQPIRTLGLIGGMSWESTAEYYRLINEAIRERVGGYHSAPLVIASVDFAEIERMQAAGQWEAAGNLLAGRASALVQAGAEALLLCTNTMHISAPLIEAAVNVPLLHICDAVASAVRLSGLRTVGLLGTAFTMEEPFYRERLESKGLRVLVPAPVDRAEVHRVIYDELVHGRVLESSRDHLIGIIRRLAAEGAEGIILGCTEIELLIRAADSPVPTFPTVQVHVAEAVSWALTQG